MIETVINILSICALTSVSPYYDCSNTWEIWIYSDYPDCHADFRSRACVWYNQDSIIGHHIIKISKDHLRDVLPNGETILQHELNHAICECDNDVWSKYST